MPLAFRFRRVRAVLGALCVALPSVASAQQWAAGVSFAMLRRTDDSRAVWGSGLRGILTTPLGVGRVTLSGEGTAWQVRTVRTGLTRGAVRENSLEAALLAGVPLGAGFSLQGGPLVSLFLQCSSGGTGGVGYGELNFFVDDNSGIYESSTLATVAIGLIPLLWWFVKHGTIFRPHWTVTAFAVCLTFACLLVPIGTEARTGLLCIAALAVLMLRHTKRRFLFIAGAGMLGLVALPFLPQSYYDRMATIAQPGGDESASTRVAVWQWTWNYALDHPLGGGFEGEGG